MLIQIPITTAKDFDFSEFTELLGVRDIVLEIRPDETQMVWGFYRKEESTTLFLIGKEKDCYTLSMDRLASYQDYRFFPYLVDTFSSYLLVESYTIDNISAFEAFNEEWVEDTIGEEIAYLKCTLKLGMPYSCPLAIDEDHTEISESLLNDYGVTIHSSTPRIYGYIQYLLKHSLLETAPSASQYTGDKEIEVDVPHHVSIGTVLSWQTDGSQATESYSQEDIDLLLKLGELYKHGKSLAGVVLNDIGTIHEYGIGMKRNASEAVYWFKEAMKHGDSLYAPTSLGDIYRRGLDDLESNLQLALEAYKHSEDPYAWYRIGQSYEEGWCGEKDIKKAMKYYYKAASVGHHLALRRLESEDEY